jgi:uncharacterized LabA/DUF88 family protein
LAANIYIDGFNLYYGSLAHSRYKWLNIATMCQILLPRLTLKRIRYFTAIVKPLAHDPGAPIRQTVYLRALETIPNVEIIRGLFVEWPRLMPQFPFAYTDQSTPPTRPPQKVQILKREEKGSDVNLASFLLVDCFDNDFDEAVVISNDSDLAMPIEFVVKKFGKRVILVNPDRSNPPSGKLKSVASSYMPKINNSVLDKSQFSQTLTDSNGTFTKPPTW